MLPKEFIDFCDDLKQTCDRHAGVDMTDPANVTALERSIMTVIDDYKKHGIIDHFEFNFFLDRGDPFGLPLHVEFDVWLMPNNDNHNGIIQIFHSSAYAYALLLNSASRPMMSPSDGGGSKGVAKGDPGHPNDAWDRAFKGM